MLDILAVLDATIDEFAPAVTSRCSRGWARNGSATGTSKALKNFAVPALPVIPAPDRGMRGLIGQGRAESTAKKSERGPYESILFSTGSTGSTGTIEEFCGVARSQDGQVVREVTGIAGSGGGIDLDRLDPAHLPGDVSPRRWAQFAADTGEFRASGFAAQAKALGWTEADLFGCNDKCPFPRIDCMGLVSLLNGDRLLAMTADVAVIETKSGSRLTFYKNVRPPADRQRWGRQSPQSNMR